tara:strand:- start:7953 stop:8603 length:651 start_codon:yes stop_codon:yes gene_type:complete
MTYWLGKDVDIFMTTEQKWLAVSGNYNATGMAAVSGAADTNISTGEFFVIPNRPTGIAGSSKLTDVTGIDFSPSTVDESVSFMGKNTSLTAEIKKAMVVTITRKVSNACFDYVYNYARDGCYATSGAADAGVPYLFDGLTTSNNVSFGYRLHLRFASGSTANVDEILTIRNCCVTSHSRTMTPDGTTEETIELYSYVQPTASVSGASVDATATTAI